MRYQYRVLRSSWGIAIDIEGTVSLCDEVPDDAIAITSRVALRRTGGLRLTETEQCFVVKGVQEHQETLRRMGLPDKQVLVVITDIWFNPCDYQEEGLRWAVAGWLAQALGVAEPGVLIAFDQEKNQYVFER